MSKYELTFIIQAGLADAKRKKVLDNIEKAIETLGGKVEKKEEWGGKKMAYKIKNREEGLYFFYQLTLPAHQVKTLSRELEINEDVLRYLIIRV